MSVRLTADGFVRHSLAGDDWRACRDHVEAQLCGLAPAAARARAVANIAPGNTELAFAIWSECRDAHGTAVEQYLESRGQSLDSAADIGGSFCVAATIAWLKP